MKSPLITVVGSFAVGMTLRTQRMPVFGETLIASDFDLGPGGKGSNQAVAAARLGAKARFVGLIGEDALGRIATDLYAAEGVDTSHLVVSKEHPTGVGFIIVNPEGKNGILLDMGANKWIDRAFVERAEPLIAQSDVVLSVLEIPVEAACTAMELGRKHRVRTVLNPAPAAPIPKSAFRSIDVLTPNETELRILLGLEPDDAAPTVELASQLQKEYGTTVVVTLGEKGSLLLGQGEPQTFPAVPADVVDTTGAGDAFTAALAVALAEGKDMQTAIRFASCNGSLACTRLGVIPSLGQRLEVDKLFDQQFTPKHRNET
jgi:ribokinase